MPAFFKLLALSALVGLTAGCVSSAPRSLLLPDSAEGVVTLPLGTAATEVGGDPPLWAVRLTPWVANTFPPVRLVALRRIPDDNGASIDGDVWEVVHITRGAGTNPRNYVYGFEWQLDDRTQGRAFVANRTEWFELHRQHIPELAQFILLRRAGDPTRFMALMLHGSSENVRQQPDIKNFETANPLSRWTAHEVYRPRFYLARPL